ncbi:MAG: hypothetical protein KBD12_02890 [Candidatus Pacebacteria bacterium]|nr:hypothetical protein [Candidatus Paceibacterota bacterium]
MKKKPKIPILKIENVSNESLFLSEKLIEKIDNKDEIEEIKKIIEKIDNNFLEIEKNIKSIFNNLDNSNKSLLNSSKTFHKGFEKLNLNLDKIINTLKRKRLGITKLRTN